MAGMGDGLKDIFYAGIGAMAITSEKAKELVDQLVVKGEITVDEGKQMNSELTRKAANVAENARYSILEARMKAMTPEQRAEFVAKAQEIAQAANANDAVKNAETASGSEAEEPIDAQACTVDPEITQPSSEQPADK